MLFSTVAKWSPFIILLSLFINTCIYPSIISLYQFIIFLSILPFNWIIKHFITQPIYNILYAINPRLVYLLGSITRPNDNLSIGMPSGHSQFIWTFGTYIICKFGLHTSNLMSLVCIFTGMMYVSYSRVYIENCHTIQQVIIGGIIGIISGYLIYIFENKCITK